MPATTDEVPHDLKGLRYSESLQITTFGRHLGLDIYKRLALSSGDANIAWHDDLNIHGCGVREHQNNFLAVLRRLKECGFALSEVVSVSSETNILRTLSEKPRKFT